MLEIYSRCEIYSKLTKRCQIYSKLRIKTPERMFVTNFSIYNIIALYGHGMFCFKPGFYFFAWRNITKFRRGFHFGLATINLQQLFILLCYTSCYNRVPYKRPLRYFFLDLKIYPDVKELLRCHLALITHFRPMFHLWRNQVAGFY